MSEASHRIADASHGGWVERFLPASLLPYAQLMRLDRPAGWWLLLLPCWWGLFLAQIAAGQTSPNIGFAVLFLIGAIVMRGAGCVGNDIVDRDIDAKVARTQSRPIASGRVSTKAAVAFLVALSLAGLAILLQFNPFTVWLAIASLGLVAIYPFMKRITYWPQAVLGLAFNWGALVSWAAVTGSLSPAPLLLYAGGIAWTLAYDTIYAHQDMDDDILIGVKSTALKFGDKSKAAISGFFIVALVAIDAAVWTAGGSWISHVGVAAAALHAAWQISQFKPSQSPLALRLFKSNRDFGLFIAIAFLLDVFF